MDIPLYLNLLFMDLKKVNYIYFIINIYLVIWLINLKILKDWTAQLFL